MSPKVRVTAILIEQEQILLVRCECQRTRC